MMDISDMPDLIDESSLQANGVHSNNDVENSIVLTAESLSEESSEYESDEEDSDDDTNLMNMQTTCLFCECIICSPCILLDHMYSVHKFDLREFIKKHSLDQLSYVMLINYMRKTRPNVQEVLELDSKVWINEEYLKPTIDEDALLMLDIEDPDMHSDSEGEDTVQSLQATCNELRQMVQKQRDALRRLVEETHGGRQLKVMKTVSDINEKEDEGYFNSYAFLEIHHEMLSDKIRTEAYRDAILCNAPLFRGKQVLDVGCGTAILSMFSAKAGAKVTGVDMSEVIYHAMDISKENNLDNQIVLEKGRLEDINFDHKFDVIVSEWMGYFLLFEGMLDSVIYARKHYLKDGGYLLPNRCTLHMVGVEDIESYEKYVEFWNDVYGFGMSCVIKNVIKAASTEVVKSECVCTTQAMIADFDLMEIDPSDTEFTKSFSVLAKRDSKLTCFVGYFDTHFNLPHHVSFSTGPHAPPTHWKQTIFYLPKKRSVKKDEILTGIIKVGRKRKEMRSLEVLITFDGKKNYYCVE